jgi:hypothetical protein
MKKWTSIDFLRLDKYIMLVQTVLANFLNKCLELGNFKNLFIVFDYLSESRKSGFYNFNFVVSILKPISNALEKLIVQSSIENNEYQNLVVKILNVRLQVI